MRRWLYAALAVSVALNVLLGAYVAGRLWQPPKRFAPDMIANELNLNSQQREAFEQYLHSSRENMRRLREESRARVHRSLSELVKPEPDQAALDRLYEEELTRRRAFLEDATTSMRSFLATLNPEQRQEFLALMEQRMDRSRREPGAR